MPRSSKRSKPYSSLRKQNRHYRQKRAQFVKGLCASAHMNGSEFLIMLASPKGQVETFASEAFRPNVTHWLPENLLREARDIAVAAQEKRFNEREGIDHSDRSDEDDDEEELDTEFLLADHQDNSLTPSSAASTLFSPNISSIPSFHGTAVLGNDTMLPHLPSSQSNTRLYHSDRHPWVDGTAYTPVPDKFYEAKFAALQQKATKRIAKAWIKVIEPKKQTRFPYNKGEASKPSWWPRALRHKEPDHLKSQERTELLIAILRSPLIRVEKLELKTAEEASFLQQDKIPLLKEIYRVARGDERARDMGFLGRHRSLVPCTSSTPSLKRHHPEDSDTEDSSSRPPDGWRRMTGPGANDINHGTESMQVRGTNAVGRSVSVRSSSLDGSADDRQVTGTPLRTSPGFAYREVVQGGPFTFQPLSDYSSIHDPTRGNAGVHLQMSQGLPCAVPLSTPYTIAPHACTAHVNSNVTKVDTSMHLTEPVSLSLIHPRPQKLPRIDPTGFYGRRASASQAESASGSALEIPRIEDALQSPFFPVWQDHGKDGTPPMNGATSLHTFTSGSGISLLSTHSCDTPDARSKTPAGTGPMAPQGHQVLN